MYRNHASPLYRSAPRKSSEKALIAVIQETWIGGVSTRAGRSRASAGFRGEPVVTSLECMRLTTSPMSRQRASPKLRGRITTPLMRLQDPDYTRVLLITPGNNAGVSGQRSIGGRRMSATIIKSFPTG